ncbi:MAG: AAA family ATPase, partial [bacterium]
MAGRQMHITDNLDLLLDVLPPHLRAALERRGGLDELLEVVLDLGRKPEARFPSEALALNGAFVSRETLEYITERVGAFGKDNRAGIERTLHRISAI